MMPKPAVTRCHFIALVVLLPPKHDGYWWLEAKRTLKSLRAFSHIVGSRDENGDGVESRPSEGQFT